MSKLKPCPFCGHEVRLDKLVPSGFHSVTCANGKCLIGFNIYVKTKEEAIEAWNARAERGEQ